MRTLVIGDIHGGLRALEQVLERASVTVDDHLIFLGDYVDGWSESASVITHLIGLQEKQEVTLIRGNHDDLVRQWLEGNEMSTNWFQHYIDSKNRMFCHAGFQNINGPEHEWYSTAFYWDRTLWEMVCAMRDDLTTNDVLYPKRLKLFKEVYIGHTPTTRINQTVPVNKANVWNIDTGAAFKGPLTLMDVDTKEFWQSDLLPELYPDEKGRN